MAGFFKTTASYSFIRSFNDLEFAGGRHSPPEAGASVLAAM
jgi:hypothetical protein